MRITRAVVGLVFVDFVVVRVVVAGQLARGRRDHELGTAAGHPELDRTGGQLTADLTGGVGQG